MNGDPDVMVEAESVIVSFPIVIGAANTRDKKNATKTIMVLDRIVVV